MEIFAKWANNTMNGLNSSFRMIADRADRAREGGDLDGHLVGYARARMIRCQMAELIAMKEDVENMFAEWEASLSDDPFYGEDDDLHFPIEGVDY